jgi:hypothetical protein
VVCSLIDLSGKAQLPDMIDQADELGAWVLVGIVFAKIVAMATSLAIGGPVMPSLVRCCRRGHPPHCSGPADRADPVLLAGRRPGGVDQGTVLHGRSW